MDGNTTAEPLSALDAAFLLFERPGQPLVVGCVAELDGPIEPPRLLERLEALVETHPRFAKRPVRLALDLERPTWENDPDFALIRHLRTADWPAPGDDGALRDLAETALSSALRPDRPPWEIVTIAGGAAGRSALLLRAHHCLLDGMSGMRVIELLCDATGATATRRRRGPRRAASANGRAHPFAAEPEGAPIWNHVRDMAELTSTAVSLLHEDPAPPTPLNAPLGRRRRVAWKTFDRAAYGPVCTETGSTVNDVALTVIAGALRRYLWRHHRPSSKKALRTLVPVSLRGNGHEPKLGNLVSAMFPRLPVDVADPLERLEHISAEIRSLRARGQPRATAYGLRMVGALPPVVESVLPLLVPPTPLVNTVCTNVPGPKEARTIAGSPLRALHGVVPLFHAIGVGFAIVTHDARLSICAHFDPSVIRDGDALARDLEVAFTQLRRAEKRTREHRREIKRLGALLRPVSRFDAKHAATGAKRAPRRTRRGDAPS